MYALAAMMRVADCQARFIIALIQDKVKLPSSVEMERQIEREFSEHMKTGKTPRLFHNLVVFGHKEYCESLEDMGGFKIIPSVIHRVMNRAVQIGLVERKYATMRETKVLEPIDDLNFKEIDIKDSLT